MAERPAARVALGSQDGREREGGGDLVGQDGDEDQQPEPLLVVGGAEREAVHHGVDRHADPGGQPEGVDLAAGLVAVDVARGGRAAGGRWRWTAPGSCPARRRCGPGRTAPGGRAPGSRQRPGEGRRAALLHRLGEHVEEGRPQHDPAGEGEQQVAAALGADQRQDAAGDGAGQDGDGEERGATGARSWLPRRPRPRPAAGSKAGSSSKAGAGREVQVDEGGHVGGGGDPSGLAPEADAAAPPAGVPEQVLAQLLHRQPLGRLGRLAGALPRAGAPPAWRRAPAPPRARPRGRAGPGGGRPASAARRSAKIHGLPQAPRATSTASQPVSARIRRASAALQTSPEPSTAMPTAALTWRR